MAYGQNVPSCDHLQSPTFHDCKDSLLNVEFQVLPMGAPIKCYLGAHLSTVVMYFDAIHDMLSDTKFGLMHLFCMGQYK